MGLSEDRDAMVAALKERVVARLRELGFKGSFPHFHRPRGRDTDLLAFQFDKYGGGFVVELAKAPAGEFTTAWGERISPQRLRVSHLPPAERLRLGSHGPEGDYWFRYDEPGARDGPSRFESVAEQVEQLLNEQAEPWWHAA